MVINPYYQLLFHSEQVLFEYLNIFFCVFLFLAWTQLIHSTDGFFLPITLNLSVKIEATSIVPFLHLLASQLCCVLLCFSLCIFIVVYSVITVKFTSFAGH